MRNKNFSIHYNGHPVAVTVLEDDKFMVQVTYKSLVIKKLVNDKGEKQWIEDETKLETKVTAEVGKLIGSQLELN